ncbi:sialate O-acetylesterase [Niabella aurantiaca]|uniref:sialate O-acetylesterase n=1 Tax=Niabella aurantiaca TaxID=379900 RepID=UPI00037ECC20|nr:sialate O-acetylesterase [Niabella aurantiaca]
MKQLHSGFLLAVMLLLSCESQRSTQQGVPKHKNDFHIFILMGQSNMSGYAYLQPGDSIPVPHVFKLPTIYSGRLSWEPAAHPLHNRLPSDRFGLGLPFATAYRAHHRNVSVGLIPLAFGGAGIDQLKKGTPVYDDFLKKLAFARESGIIEGLLWHQGESDTVDEEKANSYAHKLLQLVRDIRKEVGNEGLPVIVGDLAEFYGTSKEHNKPDRVARINKIRQVLRSLPQKITNAAFVETTGCTSIDDHYVHFDRASYILLGKRYFEAFSKLKSSLNP